MGPKHSVKLLDRHRGPCCRVSGLGPQIFASCENLLGGRLGSDSYIYSFQENSYEPCIFVEKFDLNITGTQILWIPTAFLERLICPVLAEDGLMSETYELKSQLDTARAFDCKDHNQTSTGGGR